MKYKIDSQFYIYHFLNYLNNHIKTIFQIFFKYKDEILFYLSSFLLFVNDWIIFNLYIRYFPLNNVIKIAIKIECIIMKLYLVKLLVHLLIFHKISKLMVK